MFNVHALSSALALQQCLSLPAMPMGRMPRGALSITGGKVHDDDATRKKPGRAAVMSNLEAIAASKIGSGAPGAWHPDGIIRSAAGDGDGKITIMVVEKERLGSGRVVVDANAYLAPYDPLQQMPALAALYAALEKQPTCLLQHCGGSDCAITVCTSAPQGMVVPAGCLALDAVQRINLHVAHNTVYEFELLTVTQSELVDIELEASLLPTSMLLTDQIHNAATIAAEALASTSAAAASVNDSRTNRLEKLAEPEPEREQADGTSSPAVEAATLQRIVANGYFRRCLSLSEKVVVDVGGLAVLLRVKSLNDKTVEEQKEMAVYHCFRGLLTGTSTPTQIHSVPPTIAAHSCVTTARMRSIFLRSHRARTCVISYICRGCVGQSALQCT